MLGVTNRPHLAANSSYSLVNNNIKRSEASEAVGQYARVKNRGAGDIASSAECRAQGKGCRASWAARTHARTHAIILIIIIPMAVAVLIISDSRDSSVVEAMWFWQVWIVTCAG